MSEELKKRVFEIVDIAKQCPENLQQKCFELLLQDYLTKSGHRKTADLMQDLSKEGELVEGAVSDEISEQEDFAEKDIHLKARRFMKTNNITIDQINQIFYKERGEIKPLYDDLKTTKATESQIRIAMLQSLRSGIQTGDFEFNGEEVRSECQLRKCYDAANFTANFKNKKELFEDFTKYNKKKPVIRLSIEGKKELAQVIQELQ